MVSNRDIGFVHAGQEAEVKIDTFNFTRYGLLHGKVQSVSQDAITAREAVGQIRRTSSTPATRATAASRKGRSWSIPRAFRSNRRRCRSTTGWSTLTPGMAVTVEIKTGSRHVIEYLLSPLLRHKQQALRER